MLEIVGGYIFEGAKSAIDTWGGLCRFVDESEEWAEDPSLISKELLTKRAIQGENLSKFMEHPFKNTLTALNNDLKLAGECYASGNYFGAGRHLFFPTTFLGNALSTGPKLAFLAVEGTAKVAGKVTRVARQGLEEGVFDVVLGLETDLGSMINSRAFTPAYRPVGEKLGAASSEIFPEVILQGVPRGVGSGTRLLERIHREGISPLHTAQEMLILYRKNLSSQSLNALAEPIDKALIASMEKKGWKIVIAKEGSEEYRYLVAQGADASINSYTPKHIVIRESAPKSALLEEYLHGTQLKLGLLEKYGSTQALEVHVKEFMLKHVKLLGLDNMADIELLQNLKVEEINRLSSIYRRGNL